MSLRARTLGPADEPHAPPTPFAGLVSIALATLAAVALVPADPYPPSALFAPAAAMTLGLAIPPLLRLRRDLRHCFRVEHLLLLGVVYWLLLDLLQSAYPMEFVSSAHVELAFMSVGAFAFAVWLGAAGKGWALPVQVQRASEVSMSASTLSGVLAATFALGMMKFVIGSGFDVNVMIRGLTAARWSAPWSQADLGVADSVLDHLLYFGYLLPSLCVLTARKVGWSHWRTLIGLCFTLIVLLFLSQSGGRRIIGVAVGAGLCTWLLTQQYFHAKTIVVTLVTLGALLYFLQEMLRYRNVGYAALLEGIRPQLDPRFANIQVDDNFLRLAQIILFFPDRVDYVTYKPMFHALCLPIPRALWEGKPIDGGFSLPALLGMQGVSLSSSLLGELYASFGIPAVAAGGWLIGRLAGMWNRCLWLQAGDAHTLMFGAGLMALFAGLRSAQALVQMTYIILAWIAVAAVVRMLGRRRHAHAATEAA